MHLANSFISTTLRDDLARAAEAKDGKKNGPKLLHAFCIGPATYFCMFYSADGLLHIYSTSSLLAKHADAP